MISVKNDEVKWKCFTKCINFCFFYITLSPFTANINIEINFYKIYFIRLKIWQIQNQQLKQLLSAVTTNRFVYKNNNG